METEIAELNVGAHVSLGKDPVAAVEALRAEGLTSMQIFASSPGAWKPPLVDEGRAARFREARETVGVQPLVIHAIYLINLASADEALRRRSRESLIATLRAGAQLGAAAVVTHIGSHAGRGYEAVAGAIAEELLRILDAAPAGPGLLLENSAGSGGIVGAPLGELGDLLDRTGRPARLGVALDTAHLCGAGWDFSDAGSAAMLVERVEREIGLDRLGLIHANDSAVPCGSRKDRHAPIGRGAVGLEGFRALLAQGPLQQIPWILETPDLDARSEEAETLRALAGCRTSVVGAPCDA